MLTVHGLSASVNPTDFHRLGVGPSSWLHVIRKVQIVRDDRTLEPDHLGRYQITFPTDTAAATYHDTLTRIHRLARHKLLSPTGLWQSTKPSTSPTEELDSLTLLPASQQLNVTRSRVQAKRPWITTMQRIVSALGAKPDDRPRVILLRVYPPTLEVKEVSRVIRKDGIDRKCMWRVSEPYFLDPNVKTDEQDSEVHTSTPIRRAESFEAQKRRFAVICPTMSEAHRFQRYWNQRTLFTNEAMRERHTFHAAVLYW